MFSKFPPRNWPMAHQPWRWKPTSTKCPRSHRKPQKSQLTRTAVEVTHPLLRLRNLDIREPKFCRATILMFFFCCRIFGSKKLSNLAIPGQTHRGQTKTRTPLSVTFYIDRRRRFDDNKNHSGFLDGCEPVRCVLQEFRVCWQPKNHYIKSLHCFAEILFFPLRFWVCKLMFLGISPYETKNCFTFVSDLQWTWPKWKKVLLKAPLLMGWKITGFTPRKRRRELQQPREDLSREEFFWCFIHQNNTPTNRFFQKTGQLFSVMLFWTHTNPREDSPPVDSPKFIPPKNLGGFTVCFKTTASGGRKLGLGVTFFFHDPPQKKGYD